jgi:hypothetical protein
MTLNTTKGYVRTEDTAHLDAQALSLRSTGLDYRAIGAQLGCDGSTAYRRCQRALAEIPREVADEYRALESQRLDELWRVAFEQALGGKLWAIDRCLAIMERRARLWGLDAPAKAQHQIQTWPTPEELHEGMARLKRLLELDDAGLLIELDDGSG